MTTPTTGHVAEAGLIRGLEGVVAATTRLCDLDGARGRLAYRGYDIDDLAGHVRFEEGRVGRATVPPSLLLYR